MSRVQAGFQPVEGLQLVEPLEPHATEHGRVRGVGQPSQLPPVQVSVALPHASLQGRVALVAEHPPQMPELQLRVPALPTPQVFAQASVIVSTVPLQSSSMLLQVSARGKLESF